MSIIITQPGGNAVSGQDKHSAQNLQTEAILTGQAELVA